jgi:hypothetical protein
VSNILLMASPHPRRSSVFLPRGTLLVFPTGPEGLGFFSDSSPPGKRHFFTLTGDCLWTRTGGERNPVSIPAKLWCHHRGVALSVYLYRRPGGCWLVYGLFDNDADREAKLGCASSPHFCQFNMGGNFWQTAARLIGAPEDLCTSDPSSSSSSSSPEVHRDHPEICFREHFVHP